MRARQACTPFFFSDCRRRQPTLRPGPGGRLARKILSRSASRCFGQLSRTPRFFEAIRLGADLISWFMCAQRCSPRPLEPCVPNIWLHGETLAFHAKAYELNRPAREFMSFGSIPHRRRIPSQTAGDGKALHAPLAAWPWLRLTFFHHPHPLLGAHPAVTALARPA